MRVDGAKLDVAGTVTLTTTGMKSSPVAGSERVIFAVTGTVPGSETTAATTFDGTRSSNSTGPFTEPAYSYAKVVETSTSARFTTNEGSSSHHCGLADDPASNKTHDTQNAIQHATPERTRQAEL